MTKINRGTITDVENILSNREDVRGSFAENARVAAAFWNTYIDARKKSTCGLLLNETDFGIMMALSKIARHATAPVGEGDPDNLLDATGYLVLVQELDK